MRTVHKFVSVLLAVGFVAGLSGCGTPGAPQPPSLNLPNRVTDLTAVRAGSQVSLAWTMPKKSTDKLLLKKKIAVHFCRREGAAECLAMGSVLEVAPGEAATFTDTLPAALSTGAPRTLSYIVELKNSRDRSAGPSNAAVVLAGEAPAAIEGLVVESRKDGVVLRWNPGKGPAQAPVHMAVRLQRKLLTVNSKAKPKDQSVLLTAPSEPIERSLLVESTGRTGHLDRALDREVRLGQSYEYRAQRVAQVVVGGRTLELAGEISAPVRIDVRDVFPPAVPTGLAAVAMTAEAGVEISIDLSWQPVTDANLAGYIVYRREAEAGWKRISPAQPLVGPAFHDAQVQPGHTYHYQVSALDHTGHESARSAETEESVPVAP
jgi:hypothetical protein